MPSPKPISQTKPQSSISFREAFLFWLKLGFISFGGPAGQISIMHQELVERKRWISDGRFMHALNYCMILPGPEAQQLATYLGWLMHRNLGGLIAGGLFVLPSFFILLGLGWVYMAYGEVPAVSGFLYGLKPTIAAIVLSASYRIGHKTLKHWSLWFISSLAFVALSLFNLPFPIIIMVAAMLGAIGGRLFPKVYNIHTGHKAKKLQDTDALIHDGTPTPPHARFKWMSLWGVFLVSMACWAIPMIVLHGELGKDHILTQMSWLFTKSALVTFGGAYAVLPYVYQSAVEHYHWLSAPQMMDALALGETTPGPLIMVLSFVGFIVGWTHELFGPDRLFFAASLAAAVVTYYTFLPSFFFILMGGPLVESTHGNPKLTALLTGVTAAVVGVILNLALFLGYHTLWPKGGSVPPDLLASAVFLVAAFALIRFKVGAIPVILLSGCLGFGLTLLRPWFLNFGLSF
jgi:chromate transporter